MHFWLLIDAPKYANTIGQNERLALYVTNSMFYDCT